MVDVVVLARPFVSDCRQTSGVRGRVGARRECAARCLRQAPGQDGQDCTNRHRQSDDRIAGRRDPAQPLLVAVAVQHCAAAVAAGDGVRRVRRLHLPALDLQSSAPHGLGAGTTKPRAGGGGRDNRETQPGRKKTPATPAARTRAARRIVPHQGAEGAGSHPLRRPQGRFSTPIRGRRPAEPNRVADRSAPVRRTRTAASHARSTSGRASGASCGLSGTARRALPPAYTSTRVRRCRRPASIRPRPRLRSPPDGTCDEDRTTRAGGATIPADSRSRYHGRVPRRRHRSEPDYTSICRPGTHRVFAVQGRR